MNPILRSFPESSRLGGLLGRALDANASGRLSRFVVDEHSPAVALFSPANVQCNHEGDWYGEHAGKWLVAAARAASRTRDPALTARVLRVAGFLAGVQEPDGYLGTYAPERRFLRPVPPGQRTWDGAPGVRTWDIWVHSYMILGLLEVHRCFSDQRCLRAASRIGELCLHVLTRGGINITSLGNHHGLSATVLLDPAVELYFATRESRFLDLAELVLKQASEHPSLELLPQTVAGVDAAAIGTGKVYQLAWNLVGLVKLHRATGKTGYLDAVMNVWENIRRHHLTLGGGPWGGVALRSREVFNPQGVFSPNGYVETCSTLAWIQLNRELLLLTGEARFAAEIEKSAYNDLLAAQAPDGEDWCYYIFPNGRRIHTTYWRCCKSSGAMALEELPAVAYGMTDEGDVSVNLYGASTAELPTPRAGRLGIEQVTDYPFDGEVGITLRPERQARFSVALRIPDWADRAVVAVNGIPEPVKTVAGTYLTLHREWSPGDSISVGFPLRPRLHEQSNRSVQESRAPDGSPVSQEVLRQDYAAITRGPLVYATSLIDGYKNEETIELPEDRSRVKMELLEPPPGCEGPAIRLSLGSRGPLVFVPYFEAGGRVDRAWRITWLHLAPRNE